MKYLDFIAQTVMVCAGAVFALWYFINPAIKPYFFVAEFSLGIWQFAASSVSVILRKEKFHKVFAQLASIYIFLFVMSRYFFEQVNGGWVVVVSAIFFIVLPWTFSIYYYVMTINSVFKSRKKGFLPNLGF